MKNHYITKSFYCIGKNLEKCYGCSYCRLLDGETDNLNIRTMPSELNKRFTSFPVAVNLFYGDPFLQTKNTLSLLYKLENAQHKGPVVIITKSPIKRKDVGRMKNFQLDLHICLSTFGIDHPLDGTSRKTFEDNLKLLTEYGIRTSIEFRPIIYQINDSDETIGYVFEKAVEYNIPIGYCGLQGKPETLEGIRDCGYDVKPFPGTVFHTHKKFLSKKFEKKMLHLAEKCKIPIFKKTSCLISYQHNMERDYNAHYYRPDEVGCYTCVMKKKCFGYYEHVLHRGIKEVISLPYNNSVVYKKNHTCILAKQKICKSVTEHCFNIKGMLVKTDLTLTTADVRVTKWLTGLTVDAKMKESYQLSSFWYEGD